MILQPSIQKNYETSIQKNYETLSEASPRGKQPDKIVKPLKQNQLAILHAANLLENNRLITLSDGTNFNSNITIIGDKVGGGKSLSMLSIIAKQKDVTNTVDKIVTYNSRINYFYHQTSKYYSINVIVVPYSIFKQWKGYIEEDTKLSCYFLSAERELKKDISFYENYDLVLVSSTRYNTFARLFPRNTHISRLIFDECTTINITSCEELNATQYYLISASIEDIRWGKAKNTGFIRSLVWTVRNMAVGGSFVSNIDRYRNILLKNSDDFIEKSFSLEEPLRVIIKCKSPYYVNILVGIVGDDVLQMLNAGDLEGIYEKYDMKMSSETNVVKLICSDYLEKLENLEIDYEMTLRKKYKKEEDKKKALERISGEIAIMKNKIRSIEDRVVSTDSCGICLGELSNKSLTPCCNNVFCFECLTMTLSYNPKCPMCQAVIANIKEIIILNENVNENMEKNLNNDEKNEDLTKEENFLKIIEKINNDNLRLLIFSEYDTSFQLITDTLEKQNIPYSQLKGSGAHIYANMNRFKEGKLKCLLLNARYYGSGLNLENTTDIIIYHKMQGDLKKQVEGRAQRPGRTNQLRIWELRYANEA